MSWLSDLTSTVGSVFGYDNLGDQASDWLLNDTAAQLTNQATGGSPSQGGSGWDTNFYNSILNAGLGLAGTYFKQTGDKKLAEQAAKQRMAEIAAQLAAKGGGGGGGAGAALKIAKMNNMSQMYQNYANLTQRGGESQSQAALGTGSLAADPLTARARVLV